jgi:hypothetical protein
LTLLLVDVPTHGVMMALPVADELAALAEYASMASDIPTSSEHLAGMR